MTKMKNSKKKKKKSLSHHAFLRKNGVEKKSSEREEGLAVGLVDLRSANSAPVMMIITMQRKNMGRDR